MKFFKVLLSVLVGVVCTSNSFSANTIDSTIWNAQNNSDTELIYVLDSVEFSKSLIDLTNSDILEIMIPSPDGLFKLFKIQNSTLMSAELQSKFPQIRAYTGSANDASSLSLTMNSKGLFFMISSRKNGRYFINPLGNSKYSCAKSKGVKLNFEEEVRENNETSNRQARVAASSDYPDGTFLKKYRLVVAATGEYTQFHGGSKADALAAIVTTLTRVNQIYEVDLGIQLELVSNTDVAIYTDADTDPYSNNSANALIDEVQKDITAKIGADNYDIGHVFSTGGGGLATLESVCYDNVKAEGVTGSSSPIGDEYDVDYVAHEMGHQFGATHTFNGNLGSCAGNVSSTSYEPGSGSTIMAYAGLCGVHNIVNSSDAYFNVVSIEQIQSFTSTKGTCYSAIPLSNKQPVVDAGTGGFVIPISTPFQLVGEGSDLDGDKLNYTWEEFDLGQIGHPDYPSASAPLFRSFSPSDTKERVFPQWSDILNNSHTIGEILPDISRDLNFKFTVRDGNGGVNSDLISFTTSDKAGPFEVYDLSSEVEALTYVDVTWDVANTNLDPVNCLEVAIKLSFDNGLTFPYELAASTPNDGSELVRLPVNVTSNARIKIEAIGNIFFNVNPTAFEITPSKTVDYVLEMDSVFISCQRGDTVFIPVKVAEDAYYEDELTLSVTNLSDFEYVSFVPSSSLFASDSVVLKVVLKDTALEPQEIDVFANSTINHSVRATINLIRDRNDTIIIKNPIAYHSNVLQNAKIEWTSNPKFSKFEVSIAEYYSGNVVESAVLVDSVYTIQNSLVKGNVYMVRVSAINECGVLVNSVNQVFAMEGVLCEELQANDLPQTIPVVSDEEIAIHSFVNQPNNGLLESVSVKSVKGTHSHVGDLLFTLYSPVGDSIVLIDNSCSFYFDFDFSIDDEIGATLSCPLNLSKTYLPKESLSSLKGTSIKGDWELEVYDDDGDGDGGSFDAWSLGLCYSFVDDNEIPEVIVNEIQTSAISVVLSNSSLLVTDVESNSSDVVFTITELPNHGVVKLDGLDLKEGDIFSQDDVDNALVSYSNTGNGGLDSVKVFVNDKTGGLTQPFYLSFKTDTLTGLDEEINDVRVVVTNPFSDQLKIDTGSDDVRFVRLYNMFGTQEVLGFMSSNSMELSTAHLARGAYILELVFEKRTLRLQLIKE